MKRYLVLENGAVFEGEAFGADGEAIAEIVFTTAMVGYLETLTDVRYTGQAVVQTFPLIGNYGVMPEDAGDDRPSVSAYIVREWCRQPSNFRSKTDIDTYMKANGVIGLCGIDTRALTRLLRENGTMNGMIADDPAHADIAAIRAYRAAGNVAQAAVSAPEKFAGEPARRFAVAMLDFGRRAGIVDALTQRGCDVTVLPPDTAADAIRALHPDGIVIGTGAGDPAANPAATATLKALLPDGIPTMGVGLGHQLLALANGFAVEKLKYGHRGASQPVRYLETGRAYITAQNHGYAVANDSVDPALAEPLFLNVNDGTNEGLRYTTAPAFSVQFVPEACAGPQDTGFLFEEFLNRMEGNGSCR